MWAGHVRRKLGSMVNVILYQNPQGKTVQKATFELVKL